MKKFLFVVLFISNIIIISNDEGAYDEYDYEDYEDYNYKDLYDNLDNINIVSISYELTYNEFSVVKVIIKIYEGMYNNINFNAYLKSEEEDKEYLLNCSNSYYDTIECLSERDIELNINDRFYFYYKKGKNGNITFDENDIAEDDKRVSLIFRPEIPKNLKLFKDNRKIVVKTNREIVDGGYLYIVRKSKKILHKPRDGFNKYIELNNFISHAGLMGYLPQSTLIAYEEAIRRGYHIVDANILFSKDKIPVICQEKNLEKISDGKGEISTKTLVELQKLDFGSKFDEKYKGEKILTFENLLELCKDNEVIIDLDLRQLDFKQYFNKTDEYSKIIINLIEKHDMFDSILLNDNRAEVILKFQEIKNDLSFSLSDMYNKNNITKIKDQYKDSKRIIYNIGGTSFDEEAVKFGVSLDKKIKAEKVNDITLVNKIQSWGVNYITTDKLHPFLIKNDKEDPIIVRCSPSEKDEYNSECEIGDEIALIDNEKYNIYYSDNIYNISEDINQEPIGEFEYVDTNLLEELYYSIINLNFEKGIIQLNISNKLKKGEEIIGIIGPAYDNVADCYQYIFICNGNNSKTVNCNIKKDDQNKVEFNGNYSIYSLEGYSLNYDEIIKRLSNKKFYQKIYFYILVGVFVLIIFIIIICSFKNRKNDSFSEIKIAGNSYMSDNNLFR